MSKSIKISEYKNLKRSAGGRGSGRAGVALRGSRLSGKKRAVLKALDERVAAGESARLTTEELQILLAEDRNKLGNKIVETNDGVFHSTGEALRWEILKLMAAAGEIYDLERQKTIELTITTGFGTFKIASIIVDFVYRRQEDSQIVFEDFKGVRTRDYRIKRKLVKAIYGIDITETGEKHIDRKRKRNARK